MLCLGATWDRARRCRVEDGRAGGCPPTSHARTHPNPNPHALRTLSHSRVWEFNDEGSIPYVPYLRAPYYVWVGRIPKLDTLLVENKASLYKTCVADVLRTLPGQLPLLRPHHSSCHTRGLLPGTGGGPGAFPADIPLHSILGGSSRRRAVPAGALLVSWPCVVLTASRPAPHQQVHWLSGALTKPHRTLTGWPRRCGAHPDLGRLQLPAPVHQRRQQGEAVGTTDGRCCGGWW